MDRALPIALIYARVALAALASLFVGSSSVEAGQVETEQERQDHEVEARLLAYVDTFFDHTASLEEHEAVVSAFVSAAKEWINAQRPPIVNQAKLDAGHAVAEVVDTVRRTAGPWVGFDLARSLLDPWHDLLVVDVASGGRLGGEHFAANLREHALFISRLDGPRAGLDLLDDNVLDRYVAPDAAAMRRCLTLRADLHRVLGEFGRAYSDLARWRDFDADGRASQAERYWLRSVEMRIEIDLGRLDRVTSHWGAMKAIVDADPTVTTESSAKMRDIEYFAAHGIHALVLATTKDVLGGYSEGDRRTLDEEVLYHMFLLRRAVAISQSKTDVESLRKADAILAQLIGSEEALTHGLRMIAAVESAALALKVGEPERALATLDAVEREYGDRVTSRLFRNRLAVRRLEVAIALGDDQLRLRATRELQSTMDGLLASWGELDLVPGGVGFLHYEERRHALSLLVGSILDDGAPGATARALDQILRADAHSTLARTIGAPAATSQQLVELCRRENAAVVVLLTTHAVTHRFFVSPSGVEHDHCANEEMLERRIVRSGRALARIPKAGVVEAAFIDIDGDLAFLSGELLPKAIRAGAEGFSSVYIFAPDLSGRAPFEALLVDGDRYLGLTVPVVRSSSMAAVLAISTRDVSRSSSQGRRVEMFALSGVEHGGIGIDLTLGELRGLSEHAGVSIDVQLGPSATRESFLRSMTRGTDLFIVWSHGVSDLRQPIPAGLLVARSKNDKGEQFPAQSGGPEIPEGLAVLGASEIARALSAAEEGAAPRIVLLAACDAARGHARTGDDSAGHLGGVFLGAGTSAVLLTERPIEREAALLFVKAYAAAYLDRKTATTAAAATLTARRAVASTAGFESPHYWAALQLVGWGGAVAPR